MFDIKGFTELGNYVTSLSTTLRPQIQKAVVEVMEPETSKIQKDAPYRTGKLRRSHKFVMGGGKGILCQIRIEAGHAGYVNFGTDRMRPRPFATSGYGRIKSKLRSRFRR